MQSALPTDLSKIQMYDREALEHTQLPMVTVSATFREELKSLLGMEHQDEVRDIVFSRAHFSMGIGVVAQAWLGENNISARDTMAQLMDPKKAWLVDPTNYVQAKDWQKIKSTEKIGRLLARNPLLKDLKDFLDKIIRNRLPITGAITPPLLHLFQRVHNPIISLHYEAGNILAATGKKVVQVVTDPHVRDQYVKYAYLKNIKFCVFDEKTKQDFIEKAFEVGQGVDADRVIVTGPPVDPRIVHQREEKHATIPHSRPIRLCITTGGLGTNKHEIKEILHLLFDYLRKQDKPIQLLCYAGTNQDFAHMVQGIAEEERVKVGKLEDIHAPFRMIVGTHIFELNELLLKYGFPWADCFITKPSGDMAYDAAAAGCAILFLTPWGEWEENIQEVFEQRGVGREANVKYIKEQFEFLNKEFKNVSWFEQAKEAALHLPNLFLDGSKNIIKVARDWK